MIILGENDMETVTVKSRPCEIESLKKYSKYLCYQAGFEKPAVEYRLEELQEFFPAWSAKAEAAGLQRLAELAGKQEVLFDVYPQNADVQGEEDPQKRDVKLWYLPAEGEAKKPFIILNAGGAYTCVCTMVEAFPTAVHFNKMGYHVFCLNYRTGGREVLPKPLEDLAQAYRYIVANKERFELQSEEYIVGGFSAGANLTALWGTESRGYKHYGAKKPLALFPIYPVISWDRIYRAGSNVFLETMFGDKAESEEYLDSYDVGRQVTDGYPPCYIVHCADDPTVPVGNSTLLKKLLDQRGIKAELEIGLVGDHGFGDGTDTDVEGWPKRAIHFIEEL